MGMNKALITMAQGARVAARRLASSSSEVKNQALSGIAHALINDAAAILEANAADMAAARAMGMTPSMLDRLMLNKERIHAMASAVLELAKLDDPVGKVMESATRPNGLVIKKVCVPLGVIGMIYEARPNVTVDAAAIALKTGNAIMLRGSETALRSNMALCTIMRKAIVRAGIYENAINLVTDTAHETVDELICMNGFIDVIVPRGGAKLIRQVVKNATVPVLETGVGNCHIFIDKSADYQEVVPIVINSKVQRPSVCNAVETVLIHEDWGRENIVGLLLNLDKVNVKIHGDARIKSLFEKAEFAGKADWEIEYLSLDLAVAMVSSVDEAIAHINHYGTHHTEVILSESGENVDRFINEVDAACVMRNASSRFTDGYEFGFGAEIGISTQKLHARGPLGLNEMTTYKYIVLGNGQVR